MVSHQASRATGRQGVYVGNTQQPSPRAEGRTQQTAYVRDAVCRYSFQEPPKRNFGAWSASSGSAIGEGVLPAAATSERVLRYEVLVVCATSLASGEEVDEVRIAPSNVCRRAARRQPPHGCAQARTLSKKVNFLERCIVADSVSGGSASEMPQHWAIDRLRSGGASCDSVPADGAARVTGSPSVSRRRPTSARGATEAIARCRRMCIENVSTGAHPSPASSSFGLERLSKPQPLDHDQLICSRQMTAAPGIVQFNDRRPAAAQQPRPLLLLLRHRLTRPEVARAGDPPRVERRVVGGSEPEDCIGGLCPVEAPFNPGAAAEKYLRRLRSCCRRGIKRASVAATV